MTRAEPRDWDPDDTAERPTPARILAIDDDEGNLVALRAMLGDLGQPVVCAHSGEEALRLLLKDDFAIILLDVRMPGMDGYETAALIRGRERSRHVPIIFLSAIDKEETHLFRGYAAGAVDYVFKPIEPVVLRAKVGVFIELHAKAQEIRRNAEQEKRLLRENLRVRAEQLATAEALRRSRDQQSLVIGALPIALFVASRRDRYRSRRFVGGNVAELLGMPETAVAEVEAAWPERIHPSDRSRFEAALGELDCTGRMSVEYRFRCGADERERWFFERLGRTGEADRDGEIAGFLFDVTRRKAMEEQLAHAQKMEAIGQMTGAIAHDFNNMLGVVIGSLDQVLGREELHRKVVRRLDLAMQAALSCADLTRRLLGFGRRQPLEPRALRLCDEVARLDPLFSRVLGRKIEIAVDCPPEIWPVYVDPSQFESAIVNLAINARDAMPDGGRLAIRAANVQAATGLDARAELAPGDYVEIAVSDTGVGMTPEVRQRALEPFFTTKTHGKGTGLGLSSIYGFVRQSGGGVVIDSTPDEGTLVRLYLPRAAQVPDMAAEAAVRMVPESFAGCRVLVVEDEKLIRQMASSMLAALGCEVVAAESGDAALRMDPGLGEIAVLFTDCVMPGETDGHALAAELVRRRPGLAVLLTSGNQMITDLDPSLPARSRFLPKPYSQAQLARELALLTGRG